MNDRPTTGESPRAIAPSTVSFSNFGVQDGDSGPRHVQMRADGGQNSATDDHDELMLRVLRQVGTVGRAPSFPGGIEEAEQDRYTRVHQVVTALKAARIRRGLTIEQVANASGVHKSVISRFENHQAPDPHMTTLFRYADAISTDLAVFVDGRLVHDRLDVTTPPR